jgi:parallel beta-helix repeat protein
MNISYLSAFLFVAATLHGAGASARTARAAAAPKFSITAGPSLSGVTMSAADIQWSLSAAGTGQVQYGVSASYGQLSKKESSFKYSSHVQHLSGLKAGTLYHYRVISMNQAGTQVVSADGSFQTLKAAPTPTPAPTATPKPTPTPTPAPTATPAPTPRDPASVGCAVPPNSSLVVNVKDKGAKGDGKANDTAAIQSAISQVAGTGGTVLVPAGTYMIDALTSVKMGSKMTLQLASGAVLQAITNSSTSYNVINVSGQSDVNIIGGSLLGERTTHTGSGGEWGMGVNIVNSHNVVVEGMTIKNMWGDGIYVGGSSPSTNISICSVIADNHRRNAISIVTANGVVVKNSTFQNTNGTNPMAGIDLEPNTGGSVSNVNVSGCKFLGNASVGILIYAGAAPVTNSTFSNNVVSGNKQGGVQFYGAKTCDVTNNTITSSAGFGIQLLQGASGNTISGNDITVTGNAAGKALIIPSGNTVSNNVTH